MKILAMSGFVPEQICDVIRFTQYTGERNIQHYCGYASDFISQVMHDEKIDGAVFPKSCDSSRIIDSYLSESGKFTYQMKVPPRRDEAAIEYFSTVIREYKNKIEEHYQITLNDIGERTEAVNRRNLELKKRYEDMEHISFTEYLKSIHEMLCLPLSEQEVKTGFCSKKTGGKRVFLVGSFLSNYKVAEKIEDNGMKIVGDTLTESGRLVSAPAVSQNEDLYRGIAESILSMRLSPTQNQFRDILQADLAEMKKKDAKGVIFITQKYCEPYDYLFSVYKKALEDMGIPALRIILADTEDARKADLSIEAFAEMI